jgi:adenosine deaminase
VKRWLRLLIPAAACLAATPASASEAAASALFDQAVKNPAMLRVFLAAMPKGGDLHNHLSGAPWAEDYLRWAADRGMCADAALTRIEPAPCPPERQIARMTQDAIFDYARLVDSLSTRAIRQGRGGEQSGHTQFFSSFGKFGAAADGANAQSIAAARRMAAGDRLLYLELTHNPAALTRSTLGTAPAMLTVGDLPAAFAREQATVAAVITQARAEMDRDEASASRLLSCETDRTAKACFVTVRYLGWGWRVLPPSQAFRSLILAFAMADADPRFVGVNLVAPEDAPVSLRDYALHMAMVRFLAEKYPQVKISLHAGELAFGAAPSADLKDHIGQALDAGARRIGHGAAIAYEADAPATLARMARDHVAVEINLTSNAVILGVSGATHPLALYRRAGVPVVLSTDDQGILRTDLTNEYARAATEQGLRYGDLKQIARTSLDQAFVSAEDKAALKTQLEQQFEQFEGPEVTRLAALLGTDQEARN